MALSYSYSLLGDMEMAEDARQEAFIQAYCDLVSLRNPSAFPLWFKRIIQRRCLALPQRQKSAIRTTRRNVRAAHRRIASLRKNRQ